MKKQFSTMLALLVIMTSTSRAEFPFNISIAPTLGSSFGKTEYIMDIQQTLTDESGNIIVDDNGQPVVWRLKSQLEFPLDVIMGGATVRFELASDPDFLWFEGGIYTNLEDPGGDLKDSDWEGVTSILDFTQFSYTESEAKMDGLMLNFEGGLRLFNPGKTSISALAGFRYFKIQQDVVGYDGWFRTFNENTLTYSDEIFPQSGSGLVGYYEVTYRQLQLGLVISTQLQPNLTGRIKAAYSPVWFEDYDDHILRNKEAVADGDGNGFIGLASLRYDFDSGGGPLKPFLDAGVEYVLISTSGLQTQSWYGDDPASPDVDDTGLSIGGIPHEVNLNQLNLRLMIGLAF